jgi:hypothetical protein
MSISDGAHDPSVGVRRRHLPSFAGEEFSTGQILDLVVGREPAGLAAGVSERAVDGDVELAGFAGAQLDVGWGPLLEVIPHTEGLRLITSSAAIFDQHFHATKVGA